MTFLLRRIYTMLRATYYCLFFHFGGTTVEFGLTFSQNTRQSPLMFHNIQYKASIQTMECTMQLKSLSR
jgi:hypothetical protein